MVPLLFVIAGVLALGAAAWIQRSFGAGARVGRLLAIAPKVSIAEAIRLARSGEQRYIRVDGRLDSDHEFEDTDHRPLVLRRTTMAWRPAGTEKPWTDFDSNLELVPFAIREGMDEIDVDGSSLAEGLVVVPRERKGVASDLGAGAPAGVPSDAQVRMVVEQASTVEHATVAGVPKVTASGGPTIGAGLGRPLIVTTLEKDEAMRVLTGGAASKARLALVFVGLGIAFLALALLWAIAEHVFGAAVSVLAATPEATLRPGSDTRTTGSGPGLVGDPLLAVLAVLGIALLSIAASLAYVRITGGPRRAKPEERPKPW